MLKLDKKTYLILGMALIIGIALGYLFSSSGKNEAYLLGMEQGKAEIEAGYQRKIAELFPAVSEPEEIFSISGEIKKIEDKTLTLKEIIYSINPFEKPGTRTWSVKITDSTELLKRVEKTPEEITEERKINEGGISSFKEVRIEFSEFKAGQQIIAGSVENIKGKTEFDAGNIILLPS